MDNTPSNFSSVSGTTFPADLPVLLFVRTKDIDVEGWIDLHKRQATSVHNGRMIELDGDHYLHYTQSPAILRETESFLTTLRSR